MLFIHHEAKEPKGKKGTVGVPSVYTEPDGRRGLKETETEERSIQVTSECILNGKRE